MDQGEFEKTLEEYKRWLTQQHLNDVRDRAMGLSPLPRSREEREAIYYNLPKNERKRIPKKFQPL